MRLNTLFSIILLASLLLLSPLAEDPHGTTLIQNTIKSFPIEIHQPEIKISSSIAGNVTFNVTYFRPSDNFTQVLLTNGQLDNSTRHLIIEAKDPGFYIFDLISTSIGDIIIEGQGIYESTSYIIILLSIIRFGLFVANRYF